MTTNQEKKIRSPKYWFNYRKVLNEFVVFFGAIIISFFLIAIIIRIYGADPIKAIATIFKVSLGNEIGIAQTINKWSPLLLGGLAFMIASRGGITNIGIDGQIYIGAIFATGASFYFINADTPAIFAIPLVLLLGAIGGSIYAGIAGILRAQFGINTIFTTVMCNFIAIYLTEYLTTGPWNDAMTGEAISLPIASSAHLPRLLQRGNGHIGIIIAFLIMLGTHFMLEKTILGYSIKAMGDNAKAAIVGGMRSRLLIMVTMCISGLFSGLAGAIEVTGVHHRLIYGLSPNYMAISLLIAAVAKNNPIGVFLTSFLFATLIVGSDSLQRSIGLPASAVLVFQATFFLVILIARSYPEIKTMLKRSFSLRKSTSASK